jgi:prepilin-type N-terminal cleavage/methylation domain-containing protein
MVHPVAIGRSGRAGFSLVELLVVITIIAVLIGLLLPAVQAARESARRSHCGNNLRQLATAVLTYESTQGRLPASTRVSEGTDTVACSGCWNPWAEARLPPGFNPGAKHGTSWMLEIMPHLEAASIQTLWNRDTNVRGNAATAQTDMPTLYCPSRRGGIRLGYGDPLNLVDPTWRGGGTDYGGCHGRLDGFENGVAEDHRFAHRGDAATARTTGGAFQPNEGLPAAAISDGLSNTILVGELQRLRPREGGSAPAETDHRTSQDGWALGGVATLFTTATDPDSGNPGGLNNGFFESPGSEHRGGAFFAMADGSVHFVADTIEAGTATAVFPLLGSIADGQIAAIAAQ